MILQFSIIITVLTTIAWVFHIYPIKQDNTSKRVIEIPNIVYTDKSDIHTNDNEGIFDPLRSVNRWF